MNKLKILNLINILIFITQAFLFVACGGDKSTGKTAPTKPAAAPAPAITDTTPPTDPSNLTNSANACLRQTDTVTWDESTDEGLGINRYEAALSTSTSQDDIITEFGFTKGAVNFTSAQWTSQAVERRLQANTDYYTLIKAIDHAGNSSAVVASPAWQIPTDHPMARLTGTETTSPVAPTNLNQATAYALKWSGSIVDACHFNHDPADANPERLAFTYPGDYFLSLEIPTLLSDLNAAERGISAVVYKNGVALDTGFTGSAHTAVVNGHKESSLHLTLLLPDIAKGDFIEVFVGKEASAGTVTTSQATLYLEYIKSSREIFYATGDNTIGGVGFNQQNADYISWTESIEDSAFIHSDSASSEKITVNNSGIMDYLTYIGIPLDASISGICDGMIDASDRRAPQIQLQAQGATISGGYASQGFIRCKNDNDQASLHYSGLAQGVADGEELRVKSIAEGTDYDPVDVPSGHLANIFIEQIDTSSPTDLISLSGTRTVASTNWNSSVLGSEIQWDSSQLKDDSEFSHDVAVNNHQITVDTGGDFLVVYNDHMSSNVKNANNTISIEVNGNAVEGAECSTHFTAKSQGIKQSSCSLVFPLLNLNAGDIITIKSAREAKIWFLQLKSHPL
ncbi:MAG: hypothetical protein HOE90_06505 [Bacteriovoracaceae bacterium]|nr:hypothetical protein [Bacteriovoracaceae bacterium]